MNRLIALTCFAGLSALSTMALAVQVQSTTAAFVSLRPCVAGETACDSVGPSHAHAVGGEPGGQEARAMTQDPAFGQARGDAILTGEPGFVVMNIALNALPAARNGSTLFSLQRYTNASDRAQTLSFRAGLDLGQTVPEENATFPADGGGVSRVHVELELFVAEPDAIEAGSSSEDNWNLFDGGPPPGYQPLATVQPDGLPSNVSAEYTRAFSAEISLDPGASVWLYVLMQGIAANGAAVQAQLETGLTVQAVAESSASVDITPEPLRP